MTRALLTAGTGLLTLAALFLTGETPDVITPEPPPFIAARNAWTGRWHSPGSNAAPPGLPPEPREGERLPLEACSSLNPCVFGLLCSSGRCLYPCEPAHAEPCPNGYVCRVLKEAPRQGAYCVSKGAYRRR